MTEEQKEMLQIWSEADENGKALIMDLLTVAVAFGEPFYNEMQTYLDRKDADAMRAGIAKYKAMLREGATV